MLSRMGFLLNKIAFIFVIFFLVGCAQKAINNSVPNWIYGAEIGVVASCGFHIKGHYYQQECAVQRARERLAAQQGVTVSSISLLSQSVSNDLSLVNMNKDIVSEVKTKTVKARVKEHYYDVQRDEYYVWMVSTNK